MVRIQRDISLGPQIRKRSALQTQSIGVNIMKPLYIGVRNETKKNEQTLKQQELQTRQPHQQKERQHRADARRLSPVTLDQVTELQVARFKRNYE